MSEREGVDEVQLRELMSRRFPEFAFARELVRADGARVAEIRQENAAGDVSSVDIAWLCDTAVRLKVFAAWLARWRDDAMTVLARQDDALDMLRGWETHTVDGMEIYANLQRLRADGTVLEELLSVVPTDVARTLEEMFAAALSRADGLATTTEGS